ncbi:hypothetical protein [Streptomyces pini]|uniref:Uncharacterized protein n=1 Tax=Streptomyces pini TaxID=1520580 RepID=A0A1I3UEQ6_9ACTN|nr:hypothetical protein [Streptomyces pini]SFJ81355.1 hypothetical protein SAMN05192584_101447 [Streptomyces pini]
MSRFRHTKPPSQAQGPQDSGMPPRQDAPPPVARKRRRFFLWFFLAVQILFLVWIITGVASGDTAECAGLTGEELESCEDAAGVGTAIGVGVIIFLWAAVDTILALTYLVYRLATRQSRA